MIPTRIKNDFRLLFGPGDDGGRLSITREAILEEAEAERALALMDYGHPESDWVGVLRIAPLGPSDVDGAIEAFHLYSAVGGYREGYLRDLKSLGARLAARSGSLLTVEAVVLPGESAVVATEARYA